MLRWIHLVGISSHYVSSHSGLGLVLVVADMTGLAMAIQQRLVPLANQLLPPATMPALCKQCVAPLLFCFVSFSSVETAGWKKKARVRPARSGSRRLSSGQSNSVLITSLGRAYFSDSRKKRDNLA